MGDEFIGVWLDPWQVGEASDPSSSKPATTHAIDLLLAHNLK